MYDTLLIMKQVDLYEVFGIPENIKKIVTQN